MWEERVGLFSGPVSSEDPSVLPFRQKPWVLGPSLLSLTLDLYCIIVLTERRPSERPSVDVFYESPRSRDAGVRSWGCGWSRGLRFIEERWNDSYVATLSVVRNPPRGIHPLTPLPVPS